MDVSNIHLYDFAKIGHMKMIYTLRQHHRLGLMLIMLASCLLSFMLIVFRVMATRHPQFIFLIWNLFLAFIPFVIANWLYLHQERFSRFSTVLMVAVWLLFFPNAPYIITDLIHLHPDHSFGYWYNLLIVVSCAWNALVMGLWSLYDIQQVVAQKFSAITAWIVVISSVFLGAFGIYLGRILRWNSWDIFTDTECLFYDIADRIQHPSMHGRTLGITLFYGLFLLVNYLFFRQLMTRRETI